MSEQERPEEIIDTPHAGTPSDGSLGVDLDSQPQMDDEGQEAAENQEANSDESESKSETQDSEEKAEGGSVFDLGDAESEDAELHLPVEIDGFTGPLDLLVNLIATHEMDIQKVPISQITHAYLDLIRSWEEKNLDLAGEYLVLASTLVRYKSRSLLPREEVIEEIEEEISDDLLRQRQLDYERFRQAAEDLRMRREEADKVVPRIGATPEKAKDVIEYAEVSVYDLYETFKRIIADLDETELPTIEDESYSVDEKMIELESFLNTVGKLHLPSYLKTMRSKLEIIVVFLAVLELVRLHVIVGVQETSKADIWIVRHPDAGPSDYGAIKPAEQADDDQEGQEVQDTQEDRSPEESEPPQETEETPVSQSPEE